ncbi:MAG: class I SAM-dependent methyltransferase [Henriciella sp.]|uniref:class I SAM-dependent methyltransferase n=1 Tax=Henriciella sp. TaxID=1968823 RepID=UPI003C721A44
MTEAVSDHYNEPDLLARIERAIGAIDRTPDTITIEEMAPLEAFHIGGRAATAALIPGLEIEESDGVLDIGCGTGGVARYVAHRYGCHVDGVDLTRNFIEAGKTISSWLNLTRKVRLHCDSALSMPFEEEIFDAAYMFHVGMNIAEKGELFSEVKRVLKPGGRLLVYDIMRAGDETTPLSFPLPWASEPGASHVRAAERYETHLEQAGFTIHHIKPRRDLADPFFDRLEENKGKPPPALGTATLMGRTAPEKIANLLAAYRKDQIVPVEILARKP